eukprot:CAMPEP_0171194536 /NCGR_PEP_ID=MMETSP0790-20130122/20939_1 /TAXON_ID=2925 /ORGANISM="Alexandrium catenella, Strain OF101" /LENGTH=47 /DNA_ID= /DNA_START= /DNA_END= /DNA_ORIENTATION=
MASHTRVLPVVLAAAACVLLARSLFGGHADAFAASQPAAQTVHRHCR